MEPSLNGFIIMRPRVHYAVFRVIVRKVIVGAAGIPGIKGKFQHLHAGVTAVSYQLPNGICHISQIFRDNVFLPQRPGNCMKKVDSRSLLPMAAYCSLGICRNGKILVKTAEMIDTNHIVELIAVSQAADPPGISLLPVVIPAVKRISPQLACSGKSIRRAACHSQGPVILIQLEQFRIRPGIRAVHGHINGYISNNTNSLAIGICLQLFPLPKEKVLEIFLELKFII